MAETVTLEIPDHIAQRAGEIADRTGRPMQEVLADWLLRGADEPPVELLSDEEVLEIADMQLPEAQQQELSDLLAGNREGELDDAEKIRLDELMDIYRRGLVRKAEAIRTSVERGLRPPLNEWPELTHVSVD